MAAPKKTGPLRPLYRAGLWVCALVPATLVTIAIEGFNSHLKPVAVLSVFLASWVASYFVGDWITFQRPAELGKRFPTSSKELRRRTKEFYDSLNR
jgi:hypothetical protein